MLFHSFRVHKAYRRAVSKPIEGRGTQVLSVGQESSCTMRRGKMQDERRINYESGDNTYVPLFGFIELLFNLNYISLRLMSTCQLWTSSSNRI